MQRGISGVAATLMRACVVMGIVGATGIPQAWALEEESHPGLGAESQYAEAVIAFNRKKTDEAIKVLDVILKNHPNHVEALELKALSLKVKGDDPNSIGVYEKLISLKPENETGPYHFELGVILQRQKKPEQARRHFSRAIELNVNVGPSHLFLGIIAFTAGDMAGAQDHFEAIKSDPNLEFQVVARYYLGLIHFKNGFGGGGTSELMGARSIANDLPDNQMAQDIKTAIEKILSPFNKSQWYGNVAVLTQFDSNISQIPSVGEISPTAATGKSTLKLQVVGSVGWMSSPMQTIQWVAGYRLAANKNFNSATRAYEFATNTLSLFANVKPLNRTSWGIKTEGSFSFQEQQDSVDTTSYVYGRYNLGGEIGPYVRSQLSRDWSAQWDLFYRPQKYYADTSLTGKGYYTKFSARRETGSPWWNPGVSLGGEIDDTESVEYKAKTIEFSITDVARPWPLTTLNFGLDLNYTDYTDSSLGRNDRGLTLRGSIMRQITPKASLLGDLSYTKNLSTVPEAYSYDKVIFSVGISWNL